MDNITEEDIKVIYSSSYGKIYVVWQGEGTYYPTPKLGLWFRVNCKMVADYIANQKIETIEL